MNQLSLNKRKKDWKLLHDNFSANQLQFYRCKAIQI